MKILVPIKRVIDPYVKIRVKADQTGVEMANVKMAMNPFDEIAVEEAIRLKEQKIATEVTVVSIGDKSVGETLRMGLAIGADKAIHVEACQALSPLGISKVLKAMVEKEQPQLVILGKQAIDGDNNQVGQMLAALLGWPQGTFASKIEIADNKVAVVREIDGGLEHLLLQLPAVISTDLRLNEPRYPSLPNIMKAKNKPQETISLESLNIDLSDKLEVLKIEAPPRRQAGILLNSVDELIEKLQKEAKVI